MDIERERMVKKNTGRRRLEIELKKIRKNLREANQHLKTEALWTKWIMPSKSPCELVVSLEEEMFLAPKMSLLKQASNLHRSKVGPVEPCDINNVEVSCVFAYFYLLSVQCENVLFPFFLEW